MFCITLSYNSILCNNNLLLISLLACHPYISPGGEAKQRGWGTEEAPGAESAVCGEDQEPAHLCRGIEGNGQGKEEGRRRRWRTCKCQLDQQGHDISVNAAMNNITVFLHLSVRKTWMSLSMMTLMRICHWRRRRRGERAAVGASRRRLRMERRNHARRGGGESAATMNEAKYSLQDTQSKHFPMFQTY